MKKFKNKGGKAKREDGELCKLEIFHNLITN